MFHTYVSLQEGKFPTIFPFSKSLLPSRPGVKFLQSSRWNIWVEALEELENFHVNG